MTKEDLAKILELLQKAYEEAGKRVTTATLYDEENPDGTLVVDNRADEELN